MLNLVYAAGVIETPSRITRPPGWRYEAAPLKVRSETQYLQAYLSLGVPYTPSFPSLSSRLSTAVTSSCSPPFSRLRAPTPSSRYHGGLLLISELKARIIQAVPAVLPPARLAKISLLNPRRRHIRLRDEKILARRRLFSFLVSPLSLFPLHVHSRGYCSIGPTGMKRVYSARARVRAQCLRINPFSSATISRY